MCRLLLQRGERESDSSKFFRSWCPSYIQLSVEFESKMGDDAKTEFAGMDEVAIRIDQPLQDTAPEHEAFTDSDRNVLTEKCPACGALYFIAYSKLYDTRRSFQELSDQLQLRLEEDHLMKRNHRSLIPLRWSDPTRKRNREQES